MAVTGLKIIIQRAAWAEFAFPRHGTLLPDQASQPTGPATIFNGSRNRIQKASNVGWMEDREVEGRGRRERGRSGKHGGDGGKGRKSVKPLVYWEGGRRTTDIRRLKIERKSRREQLKRRKYCELISVARGWILVSCRGECRILFERCSWRCSRWNRFPFSPSLHFPFALEAFNVALITFHWVRRERWKSFSGNFWFLYNQIYIMIMNRFLDCKIWIEIYSSHIRVVKRIVNFFFFFSICLRFKVVLISGGKYCKIHYETLNEPSGTDISGQALFIYFLEVCLRKIV